MGQLRNQVLGNPTGTVGTLVFRILKKSNIISQRPAKRSSPLKANEVAIRSKFGLTGKVAAGINSIPQLKSIWPIVSGRSHYSEIFQANYKLIVSAENPGTISVGPIFGFGLTNPVITPGADNITFAADLLGTKVGIDTGIEKYMLAAGIIVLQAPTVANYPATEVIAFKTPQHNLDLISAINLSAEFQGVEQDKYSSYATRTVFACLVTLDENGDSVHYSKTVHSA